MTFEAPGANKENVIRARLDEMNPEQVQLALAQAKALASGEKISYGDLITAFPMGDTPEEAGLTAEIIEKIIAEKTS